MANLLFKVLLLGIVVTAIVSAERYPRRNWEISSDEEEMQPEEVYGYGEYNNVDLDHQDWIVQGNRCNMRQCKKLCKPLGKRAVCVRGHCKCED